MKISALDIIAEACLIYPGWTPQVILSMQATLFFALMARGRTISRRWKMRDFAELCKIVMRPTLIPAHQDDLLQYYHDSGLSPHEWASRERTRLAMEKKAAASYQTTAQALDFFRVTSGGAR